ncbi:MAG: hypothetical protein MUC50_13780 [Myxococcota bacterium]|nr:hypothetical protein [Myxococcota bacterium]
MKLSTTLLIAWVVVGLGACREGAPSSASKQGRDFLRCAQPRDKGGERTWKLPPLELIRKGHTLDVRGLPGARVVLGALAGIAEPTTENLSNLDTALGAFREAGASAIIVAGGVGTAEPDMQPILERLSQAPVPVLIVPGAQESFDELRRAMDKASARHPQLIDMTRVRRVRIGGVTLLSLPPTRSTSKPRSGVAPIPRTTSSRPWRSPKKNEPTCSSLLDRRGAKDQRLWIGAGARSTSAIQPSPQRSPRPA